MLPNTLLPFLLCYSSVRDILGKKSGWGRYPEALYLWQQILSTGQFRTDGGLAVGPKGQVTKAFVVHMVVNGAGTAGPTMAPAAELLSCKRPSARCCSSLVQQNPWPYGQLSLCSFLVGRFPHLLGDLYYHNIPGLLGSLLKQGNLGLEITVPGLAGFLSYFLLPNIISHLSVAQR